MAGLRISKDTLLPIEVAGEAIAILAKRGAGKTNTATVLAEELVSAGVQTVILDPVGAWWGIRHDAKGGPGLKIPILGGQHGDVPIEQTAGGLIADVAVDSGQSLLLDLSDLPSKAAANRFVTDFAERLYRRKGRAQSLLHLVLEEADEFAPQGGKADTARMRGAIEQIVRRGRARGLGVTLITQRSAVLNKDVLTQTDVLIVMRTTGPHDLRAIREWVAVRGDEHGDEVMRSLPGLKTGEAWIWNPERDLLARTLVRRRRTFDSSVTPKAGETRVDPGRTAEIDIDALGEQIKATAEKAKADNPTELRRRIRELERQLAERPTETEIIEVPVETRVEVPILGDRAEAFVQAVEGVTKISDELVALMEELRAIGWDLSEDLNRWRKRDAQPTPVAAPRAEATARAGVAAGTAQPERPARPSRTVTRPADPAENGNVREGELTPSGQKILDALAWYEAVGIPQPTRTQVGFVAGYKARGGRFVNLLGELRRDGFVDYPQAGTVALTQSGRDVAVHPSLPTTNEALHGAVLAQLTPSQARLLEVLLSVYPNKISREELGERTDYEAKGGRFVNLLGELRSLGLTHYPAPGYVAALPVLFPEDV